MTEMHRGGRIFIANRDDMIVIDIDNKGKSQTSNHFLLKGVS